MGEPNPSAREVYRFAGLRLDLASRRLTRGEETVSLPPKAFELLQYLVRNSDRAVTRTELLDAVWRETIVEEGNLGWNMSVLRRALDDADGRIIETVRGYGYRLAATVEREPAARAAVQAGRDADPEPADERARESESAPAPEPATSDAIAEIPDSAARAMPAARPEARPELGSAEPPAMRRRVSPALLAALALLAIVATFAGWRSRSSPEAGSGEAGKPDFAGAADPRPALAVLPFENLSQRPDAVWLATALAEMLNGELAVEGRARTTPGESVARVTSGLGHRAGSGLSPATLARLRRDLGVDLVVVGNYLLLGDGDGLRVDFRLQSASDGRTLVAGSESGTLATLLDLVGRTGRKLRGDLPPPTSGSIVVATPVVAFRAPTEALRAYAEGVDLRRRFQLGEARARFERAIAEAPDFVLAHAALADLLSELGYVSAARAESRRAFAGASALAPSERIAIEARNRELEGRWADAAALWRQLERIDPAPLENGLSLARALSRAGSHDEARATLDGLSARPKPAGADPRIEIERGWAERYAQDFHAMRAAGERALALGRSLPSDYVALEALSLIAWADLSLGANESGLAACAEGQAIGERIGHNRLRTLHTSLCAWIEANMGRAEDADRDFRRSEALAKEDGNLIYEAGAVVALGWQRAAAGRLGDAAGYAERALALARSVGDHERELNSLELVSFVAFWSADLARAEEASVEALARSRELNISSRISLHLGALGRIRLERGDLAGALALHEEAVRILPAIAPDRIAARELDLALTRLENGDAAGTLEICDRIEDRLAGSGEGNDQRLLAASYRGRAELKLGHRDAALAAASLLARHIGEVDSSTNGARVFVERAELLTALGDAASAAAWRDLLANAALRELDLVRKVAELRLAELDAAAHPGAGADPRVTAARAVAREKKLGILLGEKL